MTDIALRILMEFPFSMQPRLASELRAVIGEGFDEAFDKLVRSGDLVAVYPESDPNSSGRQFWAVRGHVPSSLLPALHQREQARAALADPTT